MKKLLLSSLFGFVVVFSIAVYADQYEDAVASSKRSEKDKEVDDRRKPDQVMRFFEIEPGMRVFDVFAGGGYYSELMSYIVGDQGKVVLYNNEPWDKFVSKAVSERLADDRLPNVTRFTVSPESLIEHESKYDAALFVLGMHDLYYTKVEDGWVKIDKEKFLKGIYHILEDGAVFGVIDANAKEGADNEIVGEKLHRVDPKVMIADIEAAGFVLEAESDLLRNPKDDKTTSVFTPENRYQTDRSVLKFRKVASSSMK
jgi:predicted methyltransferase